MLSSKICTPLFKWPSVDILTDRKHLRKLLKWTKGDGENDFRIDLQFAGEKTIIFNRWETKLAEESSRIGYDFKQHTTSPAKGCEDSVGHYRVVSYVRLFCNFIVHVQLMMTDHHFNTGLGRFEDRVAKRS